MIYGTRTYRSRAAAQAWISLILTGCLFQGLAAGPSIGIAMAEGPFQIDRAEVKGNASLFDGSEVTTGDASSRLRIHGGARLEIGANSQARVFASHAELERGAGQLEAPSAYALEARKLRILTEGPKAMARVQLDGPRAVLVSAVNGRVRVLTASGLLVANLAAGRNFRFESQAGATEAFEITGCLLKKNGRFIVVDQTTSQVFDVRGTDLTAELGNRVTVKGTAAPGAQPVDGATQVIIVQSATEVAPGGCLATAASVGADPPPGTRALQTEPHAKGANKAVIAGVVVAVAAGAGIAVALSNKGKSQ
jgi:hypothetical protein